MRILKLTLLMILLLTSTAYSGPFDTPGIQNDDQGIIGWATGYIDYLPAGEIGPAWQDPDKALGPATGSNVDIVSLGESAEGLLEPPGSIILTFDVAIGNGDGPDIAVYENTFSQGALLFAELAYVEVSTDNNTYVRFPSVSLTGSAVDGFGGIDPTDIFNLAGIHQNAYGTSLGTPFDLDDLADADEVLSGTVDLDDINYVRIVDVPGTGEYFDTAMQFGYDQDFPIYDPYPTYDSGGFDLEAVAVLNSTSGEPDDDDDNDDDDDDDDDDDNDDDDDDDTWPGKEDDDDDSSDVSDQAGDDDNEDGNCG